MDSLYPILFNLSVLIALTAFHLFWLLGGNTGLKFAFPQNSKHKKKLYRPGKLALAFTVALLATMTWLCIAQTGSFNPIFDSQTVKWGNRGTAIIFIARAIGNFRYVGFSKTFKEGQFAQLDTYVYSPLCVLVALSAIISSNNL